jgi:serine/threonine protein kinase
MTTENDVFSFGLILYELIVGEPVFSKSLSQEKIAGMMVRDSWRLNIPTSVLPDPAELIRDCLAVNPLERLCFSGILDRLEEMRFKLLRRVNSSKLAAFVEKIEEWEANNHRQ